MRTKIAFNPKSAAIIFAPHLEYPTMNGSDIYVDRLGCYLSKFRQSVRIIGARTVTTYKNGKVSNQEEFENKPRTKIISAIRTNLFQSHYLYEKFLTQEFQEKSKEIYKQNSEALLIYSFLFTSALELTSDQQVILTHNDEIIYYQNRFIHTRNPLGKMAARFSQNWILRLLKNLDPATILAHITKEDYQGYQKIIPGHKNFILPAGVEIAPLEKQQPWDGIIRLMFCGSLSVNMNNDALNFFAEKYFPGLREAFKDKLKIWIAGSNPTPSIRELCAKLDWELFPNLPDQELKMKFRQATFSILPFQYTTGAKIKLLNSLAEGLPVLATRNMLLYPNQDFKPNMYSDDVVDWVEHIRSFEKKGISKSQKTACQQFTRQFSWDAVARIANNTINQLLSTN